MYFAIVQVKSLKVSDAFTPEDSSDKGVLIGVDLKEPEITITLPQEDCIYWIVVDIGSV